MPKQERLSGRKRIDALFAYGKGGFVYPFRYICRVVDDAPVCGISILITVPKKNHKRAVKRNKLKRRMREAFRLGKGALSEKIAAGNRQVDMALIYVSKEVEEYKTIENAVGKILAEIAGHI